jgi:hypothetical protein
MKIRRSAFINPCQQRLKQNLLCKQLCAHSDLILLGRLFNMSITYDFYDKDDADKRRRYFVVSPIELSRFQQQKILTDYINSHRFDRFVEFPVQIPFPEDSTSSL